MRISLSQYKNPDIRKQAEIIDRANNPMLLCPEGESFTTGTFADFIRDSMLRSRDIQFFIGPKQGFEKSIQEKFSQTMRLSDLTFSSELSAIVILEQVYRAYAIYKGLPYT